MANNRMHLSDKDIVLFEINERRLKEVQILIKTIENEFNFLVGAELILGNHKTFFNEVSDSIDVIEIW